MKAKRIVVMVCMLLLTITHIVTAEAGALQKVGMLARNSTSGQSTLDMLWIDGVAPWEIGKIEITGPDNYEYTDYGLQWKATYNYVDSMVYQITPTDVPLLSNGDYTFKLYDYNNQLLDSYTISGFSYNELDVVNIDTATPLPNGYIDSFPFTLSWQNITDETTTPYYRVVIREYNSAVVKYISTLNTSAEVQITTGLLDIDDPEVSYQWRVETYDSSDASKGNVSISDWSTFHIGSDNPVNVPVAISYTNVRSRVKGDGSTKTTQLNIGVTGPGAEDATVLITGPDGYSVTLNHDNYYAGGYYLRVNEQLGDGTYNFTVTDNRNGASSTTASDTVSFLGSWALTPPDSDDINIENRSYLDTDRPTITWTGNGSALYKLYIYSQDGDTLVYSQNTSGTEVTVPAGYLKKNCAYEVGVGAYEGATEFSNRTNSWSNSFFVAEANAPANISGTVDAGSSGTDDHIHIMLTDSSVFPGEEELGYTYLGAPGSYTLLNVPRGTNIYAHALWDHDESESYTVGDWKGSVAINLPLAGTTLDNPGYNITLGTASIAGATVEGEITCSNYTSGSIYVAAFDDEDDDAEPIGTQTLSSCSTISAGASNYSFSNLPVDNQIWIGAYWDADGVGDSTGPTDFDHEGYYSDDPIRVSSSGNAGIDIHIQTTGFIAGRVVDSETNDPIANMVVYVSHHDSEDFIYRDETDDDGYYAISIPDNGSYDIKTCPECVDSPYARETKLGIIVVNPKVTTVEDFLVSADSISGTIVSAADTSIKVANACVTAQTTKCDGGSVNDARTDANGDYEIYLADGTYYISVDPTCGEDAPENRFYTSAVYDGTGAGSSDDCEEGIEVKVGSAHDSTGKNFALPTGGIISGTIYNNDGTLPLTGYSWDDGYNVGVNVNSGDCDNTQHEGWGQINPDDGTYIVTGLPTGDYRIQAQMSGTTYLDEYWDTEGSQFSCDDDQLIHVVAGQEEGDKDFNLDDARLIEGTVYDPDNNTISNLRIEARIANGDFITGETTNDSGDYRLRVPLAPGVYQVETCTSCSNDSDQSPYIDASLTNIDVTSGNVSGIDFNLSGGGSISGTLYDSETAQAITGVDGLGLYVYTGEACGAWTFSKSVDVDFETGRYEATGLPAGDYYLQTYSDCSFYINQNYDDNITPSTNQCEVTPYTLGDKEDATIDLDLIRGGKLRGTITQYDGLTPIQDIYVAAFDVNTSQPIPGAHTKSDGTYCTAVPATASPTGTEYKLYAHGTQSYINEYYNDKFTFDTAEPVTAFLGSESIGFDISLNAVMPGDINGDETVDLIDVILGLQIITGETPTDRVFCTSNNGVSNDTNGDNKLSMADILYIIERL